VLADNALSKTSHCCVAYNYWATGKWYEAGMEM